MQEIYTDAYGVAALAIVTSLVSKLIEKKVITKKEAIPNKINMMNNADVIMAKHLRQFFGREMCTSSRHVLFTPRNYRNKVQFGGPHLNRLIYA